MTKHVSNREADGAEELRSEPGLSEAIQCTETYRTDEGTVFYDSRNPLAWLQTDSPVRLSEQA